MFKSKPIGWITAGTFLCVAGVALACRLSDGGAPSPAQGAEIVSDTVNDLPDVARAPVATRPTGQSQTLVGRAEPPSPPPSMKVPEDRPPVVPPPEKPAPLAPPVPAAPSVPPPEIKEDLPAGPPAAPTLPPPSVDEFRQTPPSPPVLSPTPTPTAPPLSDPATAILPVRAVEAVPSVPVAESPRATVEPKKPEPPQTEPSAPPVVPAPSTPPLPSTPKETPARTEPSAPVAPPSEVTSPIPPSSPPPIPKETKEERPIQPLPVYRLKPVTRKVAQPLTGTFPVKVEQGAIVLPRSVAEQLGGSGVLLFTPGPDRCLWLTSRDTAKRLMERLEKSSLPDREVRNFRRIYFGESEKASLESGGRVVLPTRLTSWAGFSNRLVLVGVDDHFELWDASRWESLVRPRPATQTMRVRMQDTD